MAKEKSVIKEKTSKRNGLLEELLGELKGVIDPDEEPQEKFYIRSLSPSVNFTWGPNWGFPAGASMLLWGPPKAGKTLICNAFVAQLHMDDPEAVVIKFDTEFRSRDQMGTTEEKAAWGIDPKRYIIIENSNPKDVFNVICEKIAPKIEAGLKVRMIIIDSITGVLSVGAAEKPDIENQQRGGDAYTIQKGLKQILPYQKRLGFGLIMTAHARAEQDANRAKYVPIRPAAAWGCKHHAEFIAMVQANRSKTGKTDENGVEFVDTSVKDLWGEGEKTGHKIRFTLEDASFGPVGRSGEFTVDYRRGIINTHEEVYRLGCGWKIFDRPNTKTYIFGDKKWGSKADVLEALKNDAQLYEGVLEELRRRDRAGIRPTASAEEESPSESVEE